MADEAVIMWGVEILAQASVQGRYRTYTASLCLCSLCWSAVQWTLHPLEQRPLLLCLLGTCTTLIFRGWSSPRHKPVELKHYQKAMLCNLPKFSGLSPVLWSHMATICTLCIPYHMHKSLYILKAVSLSVLQPLTVQQTMKPPSSSSSLFS